MVNGGQGLYNCKLSHWAKKPYYLCSWWQPWGAAVEPALGVGGAALEYVKCDLVLKSKLYVLHFSWPKKVRCRQVKLSKVLLHARLFGAAPLCSFLAVPESSAPSIHGCKSCKADKLQTPCFSCCSTACCTLDNLRMHVHVHA